MLVNENLPNRCESKKNVLYDLASRKDYMKKLLTFAAGMLLGLGTAGAARLLAPDWQHAIRWTISLYLSLFALFCLRLAWKHLRRCSLLGLIPAIASLLLIALILLQWL